MIYLIEYVFQYNRCNGMIITGMDESKSLVEHVEAVNVDLIIKNAI